MRRSVQKMVALAFTLTIVIVLSNCGEPTSDDVTNSEEKQVVESMYKDGLAVFSRNCMSCHEIPGQSVQNQVAPTMVALKEAYLSKFSGKEEFIKNMSSFLSAPDKEKALLKDDVNQYGLMPNLGFPDDQYRAVASYLFRSDLKAPNWYKNIYQKEKNELLVSSESDTIDYLKTGMNIALSTKSILGKNLLGAIKSKGTAGAIEFCNTKAIHLTDSMSTQLNASIKRVSDRNRNPENTANEMELAYIHQVKAVLANGGKPKPQLTDQGETLIGYYPIVTNEMCLQCHGSTETDITPEALTKIQDLYPEDKATGYGVNELRGIWVVEMEK